MKSIKRIFQKIKFIVYYRNIFFKAGKNISLFEPIRIDGAQFISLGDKVSIQSNTWIYATKGKTSANVLEIGSGTVLGYNNHITAIENVKIGKNVLTANNVYISDNHHSYEDLKLPIMQQPVQFKGDTSIGDGSWIGENVCIMGVSIGVNCVIGANSVVTKNIPDYSVAVGNPAKIIKQYCKTDKIWKKVVEGNL